MFSNHRRVDTTANVELGSQPHEMRITGGNKIIKYLICHGFVKGAFVPVRPDVEFEGFQFDTAFIGDVFEVQCGKVRLPRFLSNTGELRRIDAYSIVAARLRIIEGFKLF